MILVTTIMNNYSNEIQIPTFLYCLESMRGAVASFRNYLQRSIKSTIAYVAFQISHLKTLVTFSIFAPKSPKLAKFRQKRASKGRGVLGVFFGFSGFFWAFWVSQPPTHVHSNFKPSNSFQNTTVSQSNNNCITLFVYLPSSSSTHPFP